MPVMSDSARLVFWGLWERAGDTSRSEIVEESFFARFVARFCVSSSCRFVKELDRLFSRGLASFAVATFFFASPSWPGLGWLRFKTLDVSFASSLRDSLSRSRRAVG